MTHKHYNKMFLIGILLNFTYVCIELAFGFYINSLALISDAVHNLSDILSLGISWIGYYLSLKKSSLTRTYGFKKTSIFTAFLNAVILFIALGGIVFESIHKLFQPQQSIDVNLMWKVALLGIFVNFGTAFLFHKNHEKDLNIKSAFIHMIGDGLITFGVIISAFFIQFTNWTWIDPVFSVIISVFIFLNAWNLFYESFNLMIDAVPSGIRIQEIRMYLESIPGVENVHDLHIWALSTKETALTVHLVKKYSKDDDKILLKISKDLEEKFQIHHTTIQFERKLSKENCNQLKKCC